MKGDISQFTGMLDPVSRKYWMSDRAVVDTPAKPAPHLRRLKASYIRESDLDAHSNRVFYAETLKLGQIRHLPFTRYDGSLVYAQYTDSSSSSADDVVLADRHTLGRLGGEQIVDVDAFGRLEREVRQLRETTERLFSKFDARLGAVERAEVHESAGVAQPDRLAAIEGTLASRPEGDVTILVDVLNDAADHDLNAPAVLDAAKEGMHNRDANVRSAAARALAILAPKEARATLTDALAQEENKVTARVIRSALRSLNT